MRVDRAFSEGITRLELRHLRQLAAVVEAGSINAGAAALAISQPVLSRAIRIMEQTLGVRLLERSTRGVMANVYGKALVHYYHVIESTLGQAGAEMDALRGMPPVTISIGVGPVEGSAIASVAIERILRRFPAAHITVREGLYAALEPALLDGELDLVIGAATASLDGSGLRAGLHLEFIGQMMPSLVVRASHPLARKRRVTIADLHKHNWIVPHGGTIGEVRFASLFGQRGLSPPTGRVSAAVSSWTALGLVLRTDLVALLPQQLIRHDVQSGALKILTFAEASFSAPVHIVQREGSFLPPLGRELLSEIRNACKELSGEVR